MYPHPAIHMAQKRCALLNRAFRFSFVWLIPSRLNSSIIMDVPSSPLFPSEICRSQITLPRAFLTHLIAPVPARKLPQWRRHNMWKVAVGCVKKEVESHRKSRTSFSAA